MTVDVLAEVLTDVGAADAENPDNVHPLAW